MRHVALSFSWYTYTGSIYQVLQGYGIPWSLPSSTIIRYEYQVVGRTWLHLVSEAIGDTSRRTTSQADHRSLFCVGTASLHLQHPHYMSTAQGPVTDFTVRRNESLSAPFRAIRKAVPEKQTSSAALLSEDARWRARHVS